ncbi:MAG: M28 family peptidase [Sphingomonadaceae bacterium]|nr:M28 family peptidase [Sphingomonadaceae bacterium]
MKKLVLLLAATFASPALAQYNDADIERLREVALQTDTTAMTITEALTVMGPRMAGTESEAHARRWAVNTLTDIGFSNVREETYQMPTWVRGAESAHIVDPFPQEMVITALGRSAATSEDGITAEIVAFDSVAALRAAPVGSLAGRIAYVSHNMQRAQDGSGYGHAGPTRWNAPSLAAERGAVAIVIRSVGTDWHRNPHTGGTNWAEGVERIPAGALSNPDADNLERMTRLGPVTMRLVLTPRWLGDQESGNVIAELPGRDPEAGMILIACHIDSWDLSPGAFDDAAGCGIITGAANLIRRSGVQPLRTIRLFWAGAEEVGIYGALDYFEQHGTERHALAAESDFGADRIWRVEFNIPEAANADAGRLMRLLEPLGIPRGTQTATGGADTSPLVRNGVSAIDLQQDGTRYFDLHHTPDDTFDKIDPEQVRQNVAVWVTMLAVMANSEFLDAENSR